MRNSLALFIVIKELTEDMFSLQANCPSIEYRPFFCDSLNFPSRISVTEPLSSDHRKQTGSQRAAPPQVKAVQLKEFDGKPLLIAFCSPIVNQVQSVSGAYSLSANCLCAHRLDVLAGENVAVTKLVFTH